MEGIRSIIQSLHLISYHRLMSEMHGGRQRVPSMAFCTQAALFVRSGRAAERQPCAGYRIFPLRIPPEHTSLRIHLRPNASPPQRSSTGRSTSETLADCSVSSARESEWSRSPTNGYPNGNRTKRLELRIESILFASLFEWIRSYSKSIRTQLRPNGSLRLEALVIN